MHFSNYFDIVEIFLLLFFFNFHDKMTILVIIREKTLF